MTNFNTFDRKIFSRPLKPIIVAILLVAAVMTIAFALSKAAGAAAIIFSPSSGSYARDSNFSVSVYENSGSETVSTVDVKLTYDQSKLQLVGVTTAGSPFSFCTESGGGGGQISIVCSRIGGAVSGNQLIGKLTFKALAGSGSASVAIRSDSRLLKNDETDTNIWNGNTSGGRYTLVTSNSTSPSTSSPSSTSSSAIPGNTSANAGGPLPAGQSSQDGTSNEQSSDPVPGAVSNQAGYKVDIAVVDQDKEPVEKAEVSLNDQTAVSEKDGLAHLNDVVVGTHKVKVKYKDKSYEATVKVLALADTSKPQVFTVEVDKAKFNYLILVVPPLIATLIGALIVGRAWLQKRAFEAKNFSKSTIPPNSVKSSTPQTTSIPYPQTGQPGTTVHPAPPDDKKFPN